MRKNVNDDVSRDSPIDQWKCRINLFKSNRNHYGNNKKNFEINKNRILRDLDLLLKIRHQGLNVYCLANNLREKQKN